ncbi:MAG: hypothetical protein IPJ34_25330 [Myxococcales bacterium]|nr:hypothetical protein [Myxococcales bacterium]
MEAEPRALTYGEIQRQSYVGEGRRAGNQHGRQLSLLRLLAVRAFTLDSVDRARIEECRDHDQLEDWIARAATAASLEEVFVGAAIAGDPGSEGRREGRRAALFLVLRTRGLRVDAALRGRIETCMDLDQLDAWIGRAAVGAQLDEVFRHRASAEPEGLRDFTLAYLGPGLGSKPPNGPGELREIVLHVCEERKLRLDATQLERVGSSTDLAEFEAWLRKALTFTRAAEVFDDSVEPSAASARALDTCRYFSPFARKHHLAGWARGYAEAMRLECLVNVLRRRGFAFSKAHVTRLVTLVEPLDLDVEAFQRRRHHIEAAGSLEEALGDLSSVS